MASDIPEKPVEGDVPPQAPVDPQEFLDSLPAQSIIGMAHQKERHQAPLEKPVPAAPPSPPVEDSLQKFQKENQQLQIQIDLLRKEKNSSDEILQKKISSLEDQVQQLEAGLKKLSSPQAPPVQEPLPAVKPAQVTADLPAPSRTNAVLKKIFMTTLVVVPLFAAAVHFYVLPLRQQMRLSALDSRILVVGEELKKEYQEFSSVETALLSSEIDQSLAQRIAQTVSQQAPVLKDKEEMLSLFPILNFRNSGIFFL